MKITSLYNTTSLIILLLVLSSASSFAKGTPNENRSLMTVLDPHALFTYKVTGAGSYNYIFNENGNVEVQRSPSISLNGALPVFRSKKLIGNVGVNYYRTWFEFGNSDLPMLKPDERYSLSDTKVQSNNFRISPSLIYLFSIAGKKGVSYNSFRFYGNNLTSWNEKSFTTMSYLFLHNTPEKTLGIGMGVSFTNWRRFVAYPVFIYNTALANKLYLNLFIPQKAHLVYLPNRNFNIRTGIKLKTNENIHSPLVGEQQSTMKVKDSHLYKHLSLSKRLLNKIWLKGSMGHNTVFSSDILTLEKSQKLSSIASYRYFSSELAISMLF